MHEKLISGDVIMEMSAFSLLQKDRDLNDAILQRKIADYAFHMLMYVEGEDNGQKTYLVVHSHIGRSQEGVAQHEITKVIKPENRIGVYIVLRAKNLNVNAHMPNVATRFASSLTRAETNIRPKNKFNKAILPTPYGHRLSEENREFILFRALRAYIRNHTPYLDTSINKPLAATPLSKRQGISCSNFILYTYKIALLKTIFPDGLPTTITAVMDSIEKAKVLQGVSKLIHIQQQDLFKELADVLTRYVSAKQLEMLARPIKGTNITLFMENAMQGSSNEWDVVGYLFYLEDSKDNLIPYVMDDKLFLRLSALDNPNNNANSNDLRLNSIQLASLEHLPQLTT